MAIYPDGTVFEASLHSGFPAKPEKLVSPKNDTPLPLGAKTVNPSKAKIGRPIRAVKHMAKAADKSKAQLKAVTVHGQKWLNDKKNATFYIAIPVYRDFYVL